VASEKMEREKHAIKATFLLNGINEAEYWKLQKDFFCSRNEKLN